MQIQKNINMEQSNLIEKQNKEIMKQKEEMEQQKEEMKQQKEEIEQQKEEIQKQKQENIKLHNDIKLKNEAIYSKTMKMQQKIYTMNEELDRVKTDLDLIKSRGAIKVFIEFFYRGFRLQNAKNSESKVSKILVKLNNYNTNKNTIEITNMLRYLLRNSVEKLNLGNFSAHNINKSKPILPQLFKIIEPEGDYKKVEVKLLSINADNIMMRSIINRETNHFDKDKLIEKDNEIYSEIEPKKFDSIFAN